MTDPTVHFLSQLGVLLLVFGLYEIASRRARRGSTVASRFVSAFPEGAGRLFVPFVVAAFVLWGVNVLTGGALLEPFDRFWVGLALGLTLGMLIAYSRCAHDSRNRRTDPTKSGRGGSVWVAVFALVLS